MEQLYSAEFNWDGLFPILFFVLYGLSQVVGKFLKPKGEEKESDDPDAAERARNIREEIRKTIEEKRRRIAEASGSRPVEQPSPSYESHRPEPVIREEKTLRREEPRSLRQESSYHPSSPEPAESSTDNYASQIERRLEQERERLSAARKAKQEAVRKSNSAMDSPIIGGGIGNEIEASEITLEGQVRKGATPRIRKAIRADVISMLKNPTSARKAILLSEILGPPRGTRAFDLGGHQGS